MNWIQNHPYAIMLAAVAVLLVVVIWRMAAARREQRALLNRLKQNSDKQAQAILLLNQALSGAAGQISDVAERQDRLRDALDHRMDAMTRANERNLAQMRETVSEKLDGRLSESFRTVNRQLADVHQGLGQMHQLAGEFADLKKVLGGVKTRGVWGEMQLRALLEQILAPGQYLENAAIPEGGQNRVEFAVRLPAADGEALLPIDSKFPQEDFLRLAAAAEEGDSARIEACGAKLERALVEQAKLISDKYIRPPQTAEFAVMFLPVESLYAEAVRRNGLCERLQTQYRVLVAGPNTLAALLTSLRMGFQSVTLEKRSGEVLRLLSEVREEFDRCAEASGQVRKTLDQTARAMDALDVRIRKMQKKLEQIAGE